MILSVKISFVHDLQVESKEYTIDLKKERNLQLVKQIVDIMEELDVLGDDRCYTINQHPSVKTTSRNLTNGDVQIMVSMLFIQHEGRKDLEEVEGNLENMCPKNDNQSKSLDGNMTLERKSEDKNQG